MTTVTGADREYIPSASGPVAANVAAVVNIQQRPGWRVVLGFCHVSYSAAPAGGRVTINDGAGNGLDLDLTAAGVQLLSFPGDGIRFNPGQPVVVTLAPGGAAVVGKISCAHKYVREES